MKCRKIHRRAILIHEVYQHKNIRLNPRNYLGKANCFLTLCCFDRRKVFSNHDNCKWLLNHLRELSSVRNFAVHAFCIMPDHLHLLVQGLNPASDLLGFMKSLRIKTSREFAAKHSLPLWQKNYSDHILRPNESPSAVAWYIWLNPVRAGLASSPGVYSFAGSFTTSIPAASPLSPVWIPAYKIQNRPPQKAAATR